MRGDAPLLPFINMRQLVFGLVLGLGCSAFAQMAPVADRVAKQNALFEEVLSSVSEEFSGASHIVRRLPLQLTACTGFARGHRPATRRKR